MTARVKHLAQSREFFGPPEDARELGAGKTPFCGDSCRLYAKDNRYFYGGEGCMLMCASAHLLCLKLAGRDFDEASALVGGVLSSLRNRELADEELAIFAPMLDTARRECILLPWRIAKNFFTERR